MVGYLKERHLPSMRMVYMNTNCLGSVVNIFLCFTKTLTAESKFLIMNTSNEKTPVTGTPLCFICFISFSSHINSMRQVLLPSPVPR